MPITTINPATGEEQATELDRLTEDEVEVKLAKADEAFRAHRRTSLEERAAKMRAAGRILADEKETFARMMTMEMGKTFKAAIAEAEKCAWVCRFYADHAAEYLADEIVETDARTSYVRYLPLGPVLAVMPWNFPFWQVFRAAAPTLMAGNAMLLKHASNVPGCALAIEQVLHEAGVPKDLFRTLILPSSDVEALIRDEHVAAVTLTGSVAAGRSVATAAGSVLKKCVLELGGSDAYLILEDADVRAAAKVAATARMVNGGQSCIAGKRFIVVRKILEQFESTFAEAMRGYEMGDPAKEGTRLGPMQSVKARDEIHRQVTESVRKGARVLLGGKVPDRPGAWYPATVLTNVLPGQPAYDEEVFGPVGAVIAAEDEADAIRIANASEFGLGSGVLTGDIDRGRRIAAQELEAGLSFVNENVRSDPRMPFGGVKHSGFGRECSAYGIREFTNVKSVHVRRLEAAGTSTVE
ncbi:MAG: NAD-dependent succinate-semialdehyde dehydrogenase [Longimicrobiaceae bacterium]